MPDLVTVIPDHNEALTPTAEGAIDEDRREVLGRLAGAELGAAYQFAKRLLGDRGDAEDAVNETVLRAWESFDRLRDRAVFRPWLTRIVVNVCRNNLRHRRVLQIDPLGDDDRAAAASIDDGSLRDGVERALDRLGPEQRVVVVLRYWNDLRVDDIARLLEVPSGTVKWRLHTANRRIRAELSRSGWEVER